MKRFVIAIIFFAGILNQAFAQDKQTEIIPLTKKQRELQVTQQRLDQNTLKLKDLEKQFADKNDLVKQTAKQAKSSANDYADASGDLKNNADSKKYSRRAHNAADQAKKDAKKAKKTKRDADDLESDIKKIKKNIAKDQKKLQKEGLEKKVE